MDRTFGVPCSLIQDEAAESINTGVVMHNIRPLLFIQMVDVRVETANHQMDVIYLRSW